VPRQPRAALEAAAAQVHVHASAARARLAHREDAATEGALLNAAAAARALEVDASAAGVERHADRKLGAVGQVLPGAAGSLEADAVAVGHDGLRELGLGLRRRRGNRRLRLGNRERSRGEHAVRPVRDSGVVLRDHAVVVLRRRGETVDRRKDLQQVV
jgi:hypothetical protein